MFFCLYVECWRGGDVIFWPEPMFWLKLLCIIAILMLLMYVFNRILRSVLKVERPLFSNSFVNDKHKKMDWIIRTIFLAVIFVGIVVSYPKEFDEIVWYMNPYYLVFVMLAVTEGTRAVMEWKYASRKDYMFTISQLIFGLLLVVLLFSTDFFGLTS